MERVARSLTAGRGLLPWQRQVAAVAGEVDPTTGRMAYPVVVVVVPRRAGKTLLTFATTLQRIAGPGRLCWYTANRRETAAKIFRDEWAPLVDQSAYWSARIRTRRSQGSEGFTHRVSRSKCQLFAPTATALHSTNADLVVVDEGWAFTDLEGADLEAGIRPAQLTRPQRQTWIVSAGGTIDSTWLDAWMTVGRDAATAGRTDGVAYFEWCADPADDPDDEATWWAAHPALGLTVPIEALREDHASMDPAAFARSILNVWPRPSSTPASGIDPARWAAAADRTAAASTRLVFAFDVAPDAAWAAIAVAGDPGDGRCAVEIVDHRAGTDWLVPALTTLRDRWKGAPDRGRRTGDRGGHRRRGTQTAAGHPDRRGGPDPGLRVAGRRVGRRHAHPSRPGGARRRGGRRPPPPRRGRVGLVAARIDGRHLPAGRGHPGRVAVPHRAPPDAVGRGRPRPR